VGKTSLARMLADELGAALRLEEVEENPFLSRFYESRKDYAFQTQLFFLLSRYKQQAEMAQKNLFQEYTVSDYMFDKDRIFARVTLSDDELALYEQVHSLLNHGVTRPDLVVLLQASPRTLLERIRKRGKEYEKKIDAHYLERLSEAYNDYFFHFNESALLAVNTDNIDFIKSRQDFDELLKEIRRIKGGTQYFNPLGSI